MKTYVLAMSKDGINIDSEKTIRSEKEPGFWTCYEIAAARDCDWWTVTEV